jgi:regulator of sigma E protease
MGEKRSPTLDKSFMTDPIAIDLVTSALDLFPPILAAEPGIIERWGSFLYNILLVALGLGFVIFVHELGHFLAAKTFGVQCDKFYVGFDPPLSIGPIRLPSKLFHYKWGETEYGIGIIPLGGYVKMLGQDDDPRNAAAEAERSRDPNAPAGEVRIHPRSYAAKSVFARMVIISAGVIMNLIFGVLMAAFAFYVGVPYDPSVIGTVIPGDPAWVAGVEPGDRVTQVNRMKDNELSFRDMQQSVIFAGLRNHEKPVSLELQRGEDKLSKELVGTIQHSDPSRNINILALGIRSTLITKFSKGEPLAKSYMKDSSLSASEMPELKPNDIVVGINGQPLPVSKFSPVPLEYELDRLLHPRHREDVTLQVQRLKADPPGNTEERIPVDVVCKPVKMKSLGLRFLPGSIATVKPGSVAEKAGIQAGMKIVAWEDKPVEDAFSLLLSIAAKYGQKTNITLAGKENEQIKMEWMVPESFPLVLSELMFAPVGLELPGTGMVYSVSNIVSSVSEGSSASRAGLQPGDKILKVKFSPRSEADEKYYSEVVGSASLKDGHPVNNARSMQYWLTTLQLMRIGMPVSLHFEREGKTEQCEVAVEKDEEWTSPDRGFQFVPLTRTHQVNTVGDALRLGCWEIYRRAGNVLEFLELLVKGRLPFRAVGGPGAIAVEATDAASKGISPLLMFLTLLSANLAIINFLPIPALDGGHMVFLIAEAIRGKPADEEFEGRIRLVGVIALLCLMIAVVFNDVINLSRFFRG